MENDMVIRKWDQKWDQKMGSEWDQKMGSEMGLENVIRKWD